MSNRDTIKKWNKAGQLDWAKDAARLLTIEKTGSWRETHRSFSLFLGDLARERKEAKSTLWRRYSAGLYYESLRGKIDPSESLLPSLFTGSVSLSPESLELLKKITRVAPDDLASNLQRSALLGQISRKQLRDVWETYRPVLRGKTARGRGGYNVPTFDPDDPMMRVARAEAEALTPIVRGGPEWLGGKPGAHLYRVIHIQANEFLKYLYPRVPDVVVLFSQSPGDSVQLHGVEAGLYLDYNNALREFHADDTPLDFFWFISTRVPHSLNNIPPQIGVLHVAAASIKQLRPAERLEPSLRSHNVLLTALLGYMARL